MSAPPPTDTGEHCALESCRQADFLPLQCPHCTLRFCGAHASPSAHSCAADPSGQPLSPAVLDVPRSEPELRDLLPDPKRHKRDVSAPTAEESARRARQQAALDKFKAGSSGGKQAPAGQAASTPARKTSPAVELMRLKGRAKPLDPKHARRPGDVPMPNRLFFRVQREQDGDATARAVWASKTISAGKALDLIADCYKVVNRNNETIDPTSLLSLAIPGYPPLRLDLARPLAAEVENGGTVLLLEGYAWP